MFTHLYEDHNKPNTHTQKTAKSRRQLHQIFLKKLSVEESESVIHKPNIGNGKQQSPSQTRLNQIPSDGVHAREGPRAAQQNSKEGPTEEQPDPNSARPKDHRVPAEVEGELGQVEGQRRGVAVEAALRPHQPRREAGEEGGGEAGQVEGPQRREVEGLVEAAVAAAGAEQEDVEEGEGEGERHGHAQRSEPAAGRGGGVLGLAAVHGGVVVVGGRGGGRLDWGGGLLLVLLRGAVFEVGGSHGCGGW